MTTFFKRTLMLTLLVSALLSSARAGDFRFPVGFSYVNGMWDLDDAIGDYYRQQGYAYDTDWVWPVGIIFQPYYEFNMGLGVGATFGPPMFHATSGATDELSYVMPVGLDLRYTFLRDRNISPFVRAGVLYPIAGGDAIKEGETGFSGGVGVEFLRTKRFSFGVEAGYNTSKVKLENGVDVDLPEFTGSVFFVF